MVCTGEEDKSILALQAFLNQADDARIMAICSELQEIEGYDSELGRDFIPHITLASWRVALHELQLAQSQFTSRLSGVAAITAPVSLGEDRHDGRLGYYLLPEASEALLQFHAQVHANTGWRFEPFRDIDLPGSWWPHLGVFSIPESQKHLISQSLQKLREIPAVSIERIGMVSFLGATQVLQEVRLRRAGTGP